MKTTNIIAIVTTSLLYITAVPSVLSFGGYVISSSGKTNVISRNYHKCWRGQPQDMTDGIGLRHNNVQLQMVNDDSSSDSVDTESKVSTRKRVLNLFQRVFRRRKMEQRELEEEEECLSVTFTEDASIDLEDDNANEEDVVISVAEELSITEDIALGDEIDDNANDEDVISSEAEVEVEKSYVIDDTASEEETEEDTVNSISTTTNTTITPISTRQATASPNTNLSGTWSPIVTPTFKSQYDDYLKNCSQSFMFRKLIVNGIEFQRETINQLDNGQNLQIIAQNPAGNWNRTLIASDGNNPVNATIVDPDKDTVNVEAWWEGNGTRHKSVLRGKPRLKGGVFETVRYLDDEDILVCESVFVPSEMEGALSSFKYGSVVWRFQRVG